MNLTAITKRIQELEERREAESLTRRVVCRGGLGSGWQGSKKATVEGSLVLTVSSLIRKRALNPAPGHASWGLTYEGEDRPHATIGYEANLTSVENG
jgi:hypothetical protein